MDNVTITDPPLARALFSETRWAWIWLIVRVYVGWEWLNEGIAKAQSPGWVGAKAGTFLTGWIGAALAKTPPRRAGLVRGLPRPRRAA